MLKVETKYMQGQMCDTMKYKCGDFVFSILDLNIYIITNIDDARICYDAVNIVDGYKVELEDKHIGYSYELTCASNPMDTPIRIELKKKETVRYVTMDEVCAKFGENVRIVKG